MYKNPKDMSEAEIKEYQDDPRYSCQFGVKCYQKNPVHHRKYKHPPKSEQQKQKEEDAKLETGEKRKADNPNSPKTPPGSPPSTHLDKKQNISDDVVAESSSSPEKKSEEVDESKSDDSEAKSDDSEGEEKETEELNKLELSASSESDFEKIDSEKIDSSGASSPPGEYDKTIKLYQTGMPEDYYQFYDFCKENSKDDPAMAFKIVDIKLVGPFDGLSGLLDEIEDEDKCLTHWRYFYDPPEFQTILKGNDKDGLHFGYWRDDDSDVPVFVARNSANVSCKVDAVAENLFGTLDSYLEERIKLANPFEKTTISRLHQKLKSFAKEQNITLEKYTPRMKERERKVVARTFHGAGIVVPYDRKTQVGYRKIAATEADLQKIFKKIKEAETDEERKSPISDLQEIVRLATIAADECDFGTCLELGHNLFCSGLSQLHEMTHQMLSIAYGQLSRPKFLQILELHLKDRKLGSSLSIV